VVQKSDARAGTNREPEADRTALGCACTHWTGPTARRSESIRQGRGSSNLGTTVRTVRVHRLLETFAEETAGRWEEASRGRAPGVTSKCADADISNSATDCAAVWDGESLAAATTACVAEKFRTEPSMGFVERIVRGAS